MVYTESEVQKLQDRVIELEQQLAEARATISTLASLDRAQPQGNNRLQYEQALHKLEQQWEAEKSDFLANEKRLQGALMIAPYPLMIQRDDGRVVIVNAAWTEITGYTLEDIPTTDEWARKAYGERVLERQSLIRNDGFSQEGVKKWGEFEVTTRSGGKRIWDFSTAPLGFDERERELIMTMAVDVTDRKLAEENLRTARDEAIWLARLPGENPNPVVRVSPEGIVLYHNPPAANLPGWTCVRNEPASLPLRLLVQQALTQGQIVERELMLGTRIYAVSAIPILNTGYANLYGRDITEQKKAEKALRESEHRQAEIARALEVDQARLAAVLQHLPVGVWIVDQQGRLTGSNPEADRIWAGKAPLLDSIADYQKYVSWHPTSGEPFQSEEYPVAVALRTGKPVEPIEMNIRRFDGSEGTVLVSAVPIRDNRGQLMGVVAVSVDITDRKQFEIASRKRESILAQAGEIAHLGAWDIEFHNQDDVNANPLNWSDEVYRIFGYVPGEVEPSNELFFERVHPDDRALIQESVARTIATRQPYKIEHRVLRPDGEERIVQEHGEVFFDEAGKPLRIVGAVQDITERKRAEEAWRESEERFRFLADSMPQLVWTALPDGTVDYYNSRSQEYWEIKQIAGSSWWKWTPVLHPDDLEATVSAWQHSVETGEIYQAEHRVRMADGSYRWHLSRGVPVRDEKGQVTRWFGTATDIDGLKLAEGQSKVYAERLERSNRELEQFAFMASHDLQEPLRKIEMFGDLLLDHVECLDDQARDYLNRMQSAAARMHDMVEGLLQLSRVTTQGKPFIRVNLSQIISQVLSALGDQTRRTNGKLEISNLPVVMGDPVQLRQLMQNLIGNALKYHQPDTPPEVKVYARQHSGKVQIVVEDKGIGFEQKDAERIFQPFQRLVGRSQYEGSGMGLAICRRIVERHHGEIAALSQPGSGATFIVTLPMYQPESIAKQARKDANNNEDPSTPPGRRG